MVGNEEEFEKIEREMSFGTGNSGAPTYVPRDKNHRYSFNAGGNYSSFFLNMGSSRQIR